MGKNYSSNMETYYGFKIEVERSIDPIHERAVRLKAKSICDESGINLDEYLIYFHNIIIIPNREHFGFLHGLSERAEEISIHYFVNEKQIRDGSIKFFNYFFEGPNQKSIVAQYSNANMIGFNIDSSYFDDNPQFMTYIITFIKRNLRSDHRKIKLCVSARPTMRYRSAVSAKNLIRNTKTDLRYDRPIQLRMPEMPSRRSPKDAVNTGIVNNFHGPVGNANSQVGQQNSMVQSSHFPEVLSDLRKLSGHLSGSNKADESTLQDIEDAIVLSRKQDKSKFNELIKKCGNKLLQHTESIGAKALEMYIKTQIEA